MGGRIYRATDASPWAEALAVRGDRIVAVGSASSIEPRIGERTRVVDLAGRLLLPGFTDSYFHLREGIQSLGTPPLGEAESREELLDLVRLDARSRGESEWILGFGWRYRILGQPRSHEELDSAVSGRPAFLLSEDGRSAWVSSRALELAGIHSDSAIVSDTRAISALNAAVPARPFVENGGQLREVASHAHRFGITVIQIPSAPSELTERYRGLDLGVELITESLDRPRRDGVDRVSSGELAALRGTIVGVHPAKIAVRPAASGEADFPLRSLVGAGAVLAFGSDWPFGTLDPLVGIAAAVTREDLDGRPEGGIAPEQKLTVEEAVRAYMRDRALEPGNPADLVVLSRDIFAIPPQDIAAVRVEMTIRSGRIVYHSPNFKFD